MKSRSARQASQKTAPSLPHPAQNAGNRRSRNNCFVDAKPCISASYLLCGGRAVVDNFVFHALHLAAQSGYPKCVAVDFSFLKKLARPGFSLSFLSQKPSQMMGLHIGTYSSKVVQLRYEGERAILETYGEIKNEGYLKHPETSRSGGGIPYLDTDISELIKDLIRESNVTATAAICTIPATAAFITTISFPRSLSQEIAQAVPYEARKYVPIPIAEVVLEWMILESSEPSDTIDVLLVAVPREIVEKFRRVAQGAGITLRALEVEPFSLVRSLVGHDATPQVLVNIGHVATTLTFVDKGFIRLVHTIGRGSRELTLALERGLAIGKDRAEQAKRDIGLSERIEEREISSVLVPLIETLFAEIARTMAIYNRRVPRKIQRVNITGGGAHLKGIIEYGASKLGVEVARGNPFARLVTPPFLQPLLNDLGPNFSTAVGAALREFTPR